jgi:alkylation response protein AidB-like acyl-CoA dehydrogenase
MTTATVDVRQEIRHRFGAFIEERVNPGSEERDVTNTPIPRELLREAAEIGLLSLSLPKDVGGGGADLFTWCSALEEIGFLCRDTSFTATVSLYADVANTIYESGHPHLIERYVSGLARGKLFSASAYSEERDPFNFRSTAVRSAEGLVLNGWKAIVTGGVMADAFMTYFRDEAGDLCVVMVERDDPGLTVEPLVTMGLRAAGHAELTIKDVHVPLGRMVADTDGLTHVQRLLNLRRLTIPCYALGRMRALVNGALEYLSSSERYGLPVTQMKNVQAQLGRVHVSLQMCRVAVDYGLSRLREGKYDPVWDTVFSTVKYFVSQQALALGHSSLHTLGGRGYLSKYGFERYVRDAMGLVAGAGALDILEIDLGAALVSEWETGRWQR